MAWLENERQMRGGVTVGFASSCATSLSNALDGDERRSACTRATCPTSTSEITKFHLSPFLEYVAIYDF